jgi:hypothetical protein
MQRQTWLPRRDGITAYLQNGARWKKPRQWRTMPRRHEDRRRDGPSLDEVERIVI